MQQVARSQKRRESRFLQTWYRWMAPDDPGPDAELKLREEARRGRLLSIIVPIEIIVVLPAVPLGLATHNLPLFIVDVSVEFAFILSALLSKRGKVNLAALLAVIASEIGLFSAITSNAFLPGGLTKQGLQLLDLLIQPQIIAVALLPEAIVIFGLVVIDSFFAIFILYALPIAPDVAQLLHSGPAGFILLTLTPLTLYVIVAIFGYLLVTSTKHALERADRAETVTRLQHDLTEHIRQAAQDKEDLERDIQHIIHIHTAIAGGNFSVRANLPPSTVLWPIVGSLNNLLNRTQRWRNEAMELHHIRHMTISLLQYLSTVHKPGRPFNLPRTHTFLDPLLLEIVHKCFHNATAESPSRPLTNQAGENHPHANRPHTDPLTNWRKEPRNGWDMSSFGLKQQENF